jgi:hypothetical protein
MASPLSPRSFDRRCQPTPVRSADSARPAPDVVDPQFVTGCGRVPDHRRLPMLRGVRSAIAEVSRHVTRRASWLARLRDRCTASSDSSGSPTPPSRRRGAMLGKACRHRNFADGGTSVTSSAYRSNTLLDCVTRSESDRAGDEQRFGGGEWVVVCDGVHDAYSAHAQLTRVHVPQSASA